MRAMSGRRGGRGRWCCGVLCTMAGGKRASHAMSGGSLAPCLQAWIPRIELVHLGTCKPSGMANHIL